MTENTYYCDRCSQEIPADKGLVLMFCKRPGESGRIKKADVIKKIDLCEDCLNDVRDFLDLDDSYIDKRIYSYIDCEVQHDE